MLNYNSYRNKVIQNEATRKLGYARLSRLHCLKKKADISSLAKTLICASPLSKQDLCHFRCTCSPPRSPYVGVLANHAGGIHAGGCRQQISPVTRQLGSLVSRTGT